MKQNDAQKNRTGKVQDGSKLADEKVPSMASGSAKNFPQALVYADKNLRQLQKNHYR